MVSYGFQPGARRRERPKKRAAVSGGFEVDNREASNRVDRSHSVSKEDDASHKRESLIDRKRRIFFSLHLPCRSLAYLTIVMAGLVPAIHVFAWVAGAKTWMPGTRPGMTEEALLRSSHDLKKLFAASLEARFLVMAACSRSISKFISAMRSVSSSTDSNDSSCPISWLIFFFGLSSSSMAICHPPCSTIGEAVASRGAAG
jgi:hypothetical protein